MARLLILALALSGCGSEDRAGATAWVVDAKFPNTSNLDRGETGHIFSRGIPTEPKPDIVVTVKNLSPRGSGSDACVIWSFDQGKEERTFIGPEQESSSRAFLASHPPLMHVVVVERAAEKGRVGWRIDF